MDTFNTILEHINGVLWHDYVLYVVLGAGVLFTIWSGFCQFHALTHGVQVIRGKYDDKDDPGAINHFQALSTALSATVGLGNIGGVALAIALGGPGAVFWMWMVGIFGMALKTTEVTLSMLYRNTDEKDNPHGGPMWVAREGFRKWSPSLGWLGGLIGGIFCITLLISAVTGGNMFQAWNVAEITATYFPTVPKFAVGVILAILVGLVIIGGIKRIGAVAGKLVPFMCILYLLAAFYVLFANISEVPAMLRLIVVYAFNPAEAGNAFLGGTAGYAFLWGMKRALFSSEAGQGSAPIAHSAAKTDEPVREGVVAGLEPFIDTIVVCTLTTLVILLSGAWNREAEAVYPDNIRAEILFDSTALGTFQSPPTIEPAGEPGMWTLANVGAPSRIDEGGEWEGGERVFIYVQLPEGEGPNDSGRYPIAGRVRSANGGFEIVWNDTKMPAEPQSVDDTLYAGAMPAWTLSSPGLPPKTDEAKRILSITDGPGWRAGETVFMIVHADHDLNTGRDLRRLGGTVQGNRDDGFSVDWGTLESIQRPRFNEDADGSPDYGVYGDYVGAALTGHAFDRVLPGLGMWLVTIACWLFAISTMISWAYYGEQGMIYMLGEKSVLWYKLVYCGLIIVATLGFIRTDAQLDGLTALGTGVMLAANIPIMLIFGFQAMKAYHTYFRRLRSGEMEPPHDAPSFSDVIEGRDVE